MQNPWKYVSLWRTVSDRCPVDKPRSSSGGVSFDVNVINLSKSLKMYRNVLLFGVLKDLGSVFSSSRTPDTRSRCRKRRLKLQFRGVNKCLPVATLLRTVSYHPRQPPSQMCPWTRPFCQQFFVWKKYLSFFFQNFLSSDLAQGNPRFVLDWKIK